MCRIFRDAIPALPLWTSFPHPLYPTLNGLMDRLNHLGNDYVDVKAADISIGLQVYFDRTEYSWAVKLVCQSDHTIITKINSDGTYNITGKNNVTLSKIKQKVTHALPLLFFIDKGVHEIEMNTNDGNFNRNILYIRIPISIVGESREHCIVIGGLYMEGAKKEDDVNVSDLTLRDSKGCGVHSQRTVYVTQSGAAIHLDNVSVENSEMQGISVLGGKRHSMKNCNVSHSGYNGLCVGDGIMTIDGNDTTIHHNCTKGESDSYGLYTSWSTSSIHLPYSLTIEIISKNNGGGGNYGGVNPDGGGPGPIIIGLSM